MKNIQEEEKDMIKNSNQDFFSKKKIQIFIIRGYQWKEQTNGWWSENDLRKKFC